MVYLLFDLENVDVVIGIYVLGDEDEEEAIVA